MGQPKQSTLIKKDRMEIKRTDTELDGLFGKTKDVIEELFNMKDPVKEKKLQFMKKSGFYEIPGGLLEHAIRGLVYSLSAFCKEFDIPIDIIEKSPYIKVDMEKIRDNVAVGKAFMAFQEYVTELEKAIEDFPQLIEKTEELAKEAPQLKR